MPSTPSKALMATIGELPPGDVPAAWFSSTSPEVVKGYDAFIGANRNWNTAYKTLLEEAELPGDTAFVSHASHRLVGLRPKSGTITPRWLRKDRTGDLVPRKRTQAEKTSRVNQLWELCVDIPQAENFIPGIPTFVYHHDRILRVKFRKPAEAVLAFMGVSPEDATEPFEVDSQWSRMKMSTYHALREAQGDPVRA